MLSGVTSFYELLKCVAQFVVLYVMMLLYQILWHQVVACFVCLFGFISQLIQFVLECHDE